MSILYKPSCNYDDNFAYPLYFHVVMKAYGFWPTAGDPNSFRFRVLDNLYIFWNWFVTWSVTLTGFAELMYLLANHEDVSQAVENACTIIIAMTVAVRMTHMRYAMASMKTIMRVFADRIWINKKRHPLIYNRCIAQMKPTLFKSISLISALVFYSGMPIVILITTEQTLASTDKRLPYYMLMPYDIQTTTNYIITYIGCSFSSTACILQFCAMDAIFALFVSFSCGQFELLHGRISRLIPQCHAEWLRHYGEEAPVYCGSLDLLQDIYNKRLHELAAYQNELISFCMKLEKFFSFPLAVNVITSALLIGLAGFQFLIGGRNSMFDFVRFFLFFLSVTGQLYVICDLGALLIVRSSDTSRYLFMCNWEGGLISENSPLLIQRDDKELDALSVKLPSWRYIHYHPTGKDFQQKLRFMIMRSHRPLEMTAMKFTVLSLETFSRILSSSLSYFTLLKSFLDKQN